MNKQKSDQLTLAMAFPGSLVMLGSLVALFFVNGDEARRHAVNSLFVGTCVTAIAGTIPVAQSLLPSQD